MHNSVCATDPGSLGDDYPCLSMGVAWGGRATYVIHDGGSMRFERSDYRQFEDAIKSILKTLCTDKEIKEVSNILTMGTTNGAVLNQKRWIWTHKTGEVFVTKDSPNALILNILPHYDQKIDVNALPYGEADGEPDESQEFCGLRMPESNAPS